MKIIACIDKSNGMMFNNRRVSKDSKVIDKILEIANSSNIYVSSYTSSLFENIPNIIIDNFNDIKEDEFVFIEDNEIPEGVIDEIYLFNWNRDYPADKYFEVDLNEYKKVSKEDFEGTSHKKITLEIYKRVENEKVC